MGDRDKKVSSIIAIEKKKKVKLQQFETNATGH